ncbi:MAG TPA: type II toxin-antitoxin system prevent-host-death family antitoxin [Bacteroidetes bacterium]|jgi:antitoxin (DNA-binding transcriptional repressor) of toxin-antitoxin stability system|nr:type II toxin-antitoxin system prevent-host-death family antitoxin [Bacteroidota bacterium]
MTVTAKDLRFNISMLFDVLSKGEDILITYRGKAKAKLIAYNQPSNDKKTDTIFGMWQDREEDVDTMVRNMRKGRNFGI